MRLTLKRGTGTSSVSSTLFSYDASTLAFTNETVIAKATNNVIARTQDSCGRASGIALGTAYAVDYTCDSVGRFSRRSPPPFCPFRPLPITPMSLAQTSLHPRPHLIRPMSSYISDKTYEPHRDLITTVSNVCDSTAISAFEYQNDALSRRTDRGSLPIIMRTRKQR